MNPFTCLYHFIKQLFNIVAEAGDQVANLSARTYTPTPLATAEELQAIIDQHELHQFLVYKKAYLQTTRWQELRQYRLQIDNYQCQECGQTHSLNTHHLHYRSLGREQLTDIVTLCQFCHTSRHEQIGYPQTVEHYMAFTDTLV